MWNNTKKIYIWGAGDDGKRILNNCGSLAFLVQGVIDIRKSEVEKEGFYNLPVYLPDEICLEEAFIVIATRKYRDQVEKYLIEKNKIEYIDYITFEMAFNICRFRQRGMNIRTEKRYIELLESINSFAKWIADVNKKVCVNRDILNKYILTGGMTAAECILRCCADLDKNEIEFKDGTVLEYVDIKDLANIIVEILIQEDYFFETSSDAPVIIDGGTNIGLALFYFKTIYPTSKIIAFEPNPELYKILERNIKRNNWNDIKVYPYALGRDEKNKVTFYIQDSCIAGSLEKRNTIGIDEKSVKEIEVEEVALRKYISEEIDYLKLDIEGAETKVIEDIEPVIKNIKHIFIEFHDGPLKNYNYISKILSILENAGFDVNTGKAIFSAYQGMYRPMNQVGNRVSENIWAKRV